MKRRALAVVAAVLGVLAVVGIAASAGGSGLSESGVTVALNRFVNPPGLIDANNSPSLARNPTRPDNVVVTSRKDLPSYSAEVHSSDDDGVTWATTTLPLPEGRDRPFGADAAFGPDGTLYVAYVNLQGAGNRPETLWVSKSTDGGRTMSPPVELAGKLSFQVRLVVGDDGTVYVVWLKVQDVAPLSIVDGDNPVVVARSTDGAMTFSEPVRVSDPERRRVGAASPVIDDTGRLVVLYQDFKDDRRDFQNLDGPVWEQPFGLVVARSDDDGTSFAPGVELESNVVPVSRFLVFLPEFPSIAAGEDDELYVSWADGRDGDQDVYLRRSGDAGRTWGAAVRVNDTLRRDGTSQYLPRLDVADNGRVDVVFLDRRHDPSNLSADAYLASSDDDGRTFTNVRLSSASFDSRVGFSANPRLEADFGSRIGVSSLDGGALAVWTDTRLGSQDTGRQDIASARVEIEADKAGGLGQTPVIAVLLVLAALALAGAIFTGRAQTAPPHGKVTT